MRCPKDGSSMKEFHIDNIPLDYCSSCHGIWMDWGELRRVSSDLVTEYELLYRGDSNLDCPKCGKSMRMADLHSAIVEECGCGIFFDVGEADKVLGKNISIECSERIGLTKEQVEKLGREGSIKLGRFELFIDDQQ